MFRHFAAHCRKLHCNEEMWNRYSGNFLKYTIDYCHFLASFDTSKSFPYASNDLREANEMVIISDNMDAVNVITIIII